MNTSFILGLLLALFLAVSMAVSPGLITSINTQGITRVAQQALPYAIRLIKEVEIPPVEQSHMTISDIAIPNLSVESFQLTPADSGIALDITGLHVNVRAHFKYKQGILKFSGDVSGSAKARAHLAAKIYPNGDHFSIDVTEADVDIQDFSLKISGGLIAKLLNLVKSLFNSLIKKTIKNKVGPAISAAILQVARQYVDAIPSSAPFGPLSLSLAPAGAGTLAAGNNLSFLFDARINGVEAERHDIDQSFVPAGDFTGMVDVSVFNSGLASIPFKTLEYTEDHPGSLPVPGWKCHHWHDLIPLMDQEQYRELPVKVAINLADSPVMVSQGGILSLSAPGQYSVFCGETLMAKIRADLGGGVAVSLETKEDGRQYLFPQLVNVGVKFTVEWTLDGTVFPVVGGLEIVLNVATQVVTGVINLVMLNGILIPSVSGLQFLNAQIDFPANAIRFQTELNYTPPTSWF